MQPQSDYSQNLPILERVDYTRSVQGLPPMPRGLRLLILLVRIAPALVQAALAAAIYTSPRPSLTTEWLLATYAFSVEGYSAWALLFSVLSLYWSFSGFWRRNPVLRVGGEVIFTVPLLFYVVCSTWYTAFVDGTSPRVPTVLYVALYVGLISMYANNAALSSWFEHVHQLQLRAAEKGLTHG